MKDISYEILELMDRYGSDEKGLRQILEQDNRPEILMALTPIRENLVDWMEIGPEERVLQYGSDYGAVTGCLARKAGEVLVSDTRPENLEVNKRRHKEFANIRYQFGDLWELKEDGFDLVCLIGPKTKEETLGIQKKTEGQNKRAEALAYCHQLIERAASLVRPGGRLAVVIPNSKALKIWAGGELDEQELSVTLSDLQSILGQIKGRSYFYYPLPDYKLPTAIYSDEYLPVKGELPNLFMEYEKPRYRLFSEEAVYDMICEGGGFGQFASAFFVIWEKEDEPGAR